MRIVVPLDLSDTSARALAPAVDIARALGDELVLVTVNGSRLRADLSIKELAASEHVDIPDLIEAYLKSRAAEIKGVDVSYDMLAGEGADTTLIDYSKTDGIRMIVMATHGRSGLDRWRMGSVTDRVVRHASSPVLVIPTRRD